MNRLPRRRALASLSRWLGASLVATIVLPTPSLAQSPAPAAYPSRPIRMVVPFPPGGSSDILGRLVADQLGKLLGGTIVVENKPGGTTQIGTEYVANATPDGYTMLLAAASSFTVLPNLRKLNYTLDSFEAIGGVADYIAVMAVRKGLPVKNLQEFVAYAKANPGKLTYGSAGEASAGHVFGGTLSRDTGIQLLHVPFRGSADAVNALVAGEIDFVIDGAATPMIKAGRVVPIATFARARHVELPDLPTTREAGFDISFAKGAGWGVLVPKGTPQPVVDKLADALRRTVEDKTVQQAFQKANSVGSWQTPEAFRAGLLNDQKMYATLLPEIGVQKNQ